MTVGARLVWPGSTSPCAPHTPLPGAGIWLTLSDRVVKSRELCWLPSALGQSTDLL